MDTPTLVIDKGKKASKGLYRDQYKLFRDFELAVMYARERGYESLMEPDPKPGVLNLYMGGDVNISIMRLDFEP